jgi:N-methylhydantoinase A/oxoprolinase/acetone carboxylase beta subunit
MSSNGGGDPLLGEGEGVFGRRSYPTRYYDRARLAVGATVEGPAVLFQRDTTTVVPPGWIARADASGSLVISR